jgi:hypothetical protein
MITEEEVKALRKKWRTFYKTWGNQHPTWNQSETWTNVIDKLKSPRNKQVYRNAGLRFFAFIDETPEQVYTNRLEHLKSDDPNVRANYEDRAELYKRKLESLHYGRETITTDLGVVSGFFRYSRLPLSLIRGFWDINESEYVRDSKPTRRYPDIGEIRDIYRASTENGKIATLFGYHCGLTNIDVVLLTWSRLNVDWENVDEDKDFIPVRFERQKTRVEGWLVLSPDILTLLRSKWIRDGKPENGYVLNYRGEKLRPVVPNNWFKEACEKTLGAERTKDLSFTDLRDAFNDIVARAEFKQEIKDTLMGHKLLGARGEYYVSPQTIALKYRDIFSELTIDGWMRKDEELDEMRQKVDLLSESEAEHKATIKALTSSFNLLKTQNEELKKTIDEIKGKVIELQIPDWVRENWRKEEESRKTAKTPKG